MKNTNIHKTLGGIMQIAKNILGGAFNTNNEFRRLCVERKVDNYVLVLP